MQVVMSVPDMVGGINEILRQVLRGKFNRTVLVCRKHEGKVRIMTRTLDRFSVKQSPTMQFLVKKFFSVDDTAKKVPELFHD